jgi:hypothetical protein
MPKVLCSSSIPKCYQKLTKETNVRLVPCIMHAMGLVRWVGDFLAMVEFFRGDACVAVGGYGGLGCYGEGGWV